MGFLRFFFQLQKCVERTPEIRPCFSSLQSLLSDSGVGTFSSFHKNWRTRFSTEAIDQKLSFISSQNSVNTKVIGQFEMGGLDHSRAIHVLENAEFCVESVDESGVCGHKRTAEEADRICRMLANNPSSSIESSLDSLGIQVAPELVEEVLRKLSNAGILALSFLRWAEKRDGFKYTTETFHALVDALGKIKQFSLIWKLVDTMKGTGLLTRETFALITRKYARARKVKEAIESFERMSHYGFQPQLSDYNRLIDTLSKSKNVKRSLDIFENMKKKMILPDLKTYTILLEGLGQERNLLKMMDVYQEMKDEGFEPDAVTYGILINAYCKAKEYEEAVKLFHEMGAKNCQPTPHIYCTLINGLGSAKRLNEALKLFELSKASGFAPEIPTYNAVVGSYCWAMQFEEAFKVVEEMKKCGVGPNSRTYDVIINHLIRAHKNKEATEVFQQMSEEVGCEPGLNTYTMMISMFCAEGRVDKAMKVWKQMNDRGVLPCMHMFSALINGLCDENRLQEACKYFEEMLDKGIRPPGSLYSNLKEALLDAGKKELAVTMGVKLDKLRKTALEG